MTQTEKWHWNQLLLPEAQDDHLLVVFCACDLGLNLYYRIYLKLHLVLHGNILKMSF